MWAETHVRHVCVSLSCENESELNKILISDEMTSLQWISESEVTATEPQPDSNSSSYTITTEQTMPWYPVGLHHSPPYISIHTHFSLSSLLLFTRLPPSLPLTSQQDAHRGSVSIMWIRFSSNSFRGVQCKSVKPAINLALPCLKEPLAYLKELLVENPTGGLLTLARIRLETENFKVRLCQF